MGLGVTLAMCTYNGSALIPETIRHIAQQQVESAIDWEVIVVDNASVDNTSEVVQQEWKKYNCSVPFTLLHQPRQGLTFARELALKESKYDFVLFCDDDNWLNPNYINLVYEIMTQHPSIGVLGGHGELVYEESPPKWALEFSLFGNGPQETKSGKVKRNLVYGAGSTLRRSAFKEIFNAGYQPFLTDRLANSLSSGGDSELCYAAALAGYDIWYDDRLRFRHFMPKGRITWNYHRRFFEEGAQCFEVLIPYSLIVNFGSRSIYSFHLNLMRLLLFTARRICFLLVKCLILNKDSETVKVNSLRLLALKERLLSFRKYSSMKSNFKKILKFKQEDLNCVSSKALLRHEEVASIDISY